MWYQRRNPARAVTGGISGCLVLVAIALAFAFGFGSFNLPVFFVVMAFVVFIGSLSSLNPRSIVGGIIGAMWMIILALFFLTHTWIWFLIGAALSVLLGSLLRPIAAALVGLGLFGFLSSLSNQQPQQPYYQPTPQPQQPYQQGYQPQQDYQGQPETYQEGGRQYEYPRSSEQPQAQYPQQMPPQEQ